jgi:hypothetical protein
MFLWVMIVLMALEFVMKLTWLAKGQRQTLSAMDLAADVFCNAALCVWAVVLLVQQ